MSDLFGVAGQQLLARVELAVAARARVNSQLRLIATLDFEVELFAKLVAGRLRTHPGYVAIQVIPGIGPVLAAVFVAEIGDVGRFPGPPQLASWARADPTPPRVRHHRPPWTDHQAGFPTRALGRDRGRATRARAHPSRAGPRPGRGTARTQHRRRGRRPRADRAGLLRPTRSPHPLPGTANRGGMSSTADRGGGADRPGHDPRVPARSSSLIDPAPPRTRRSTPCRPARRRDDRQPPPAGACPACRGIGAGARTPIHRHRDDHGAGPTPSSTLNSMRCTTSTSHTGAPKSRRTTAGTKIKSKNWGLTGPAPSGMTCFFCGAALGSRTPDLRITRNFAGRYSMHPVHRCTSPSSRCTPSSGVSRRFVPRTVPRRRSTTGPITTLCTGDLPDRTPQAGRRIASLHTTVPVS